MRAWARASRWGDARDVETVTPDTPILGAATKLLKHRFGCLPVVDAQGDLVGIVSEHDILREMVLILAEQ